MWINLISVKEFNDAPVGHTFRLQCSQRIHPSKADLSITKTSDDEAVVIVENAYREG